MSRIILGTRGSDLARAQTSLVQTALRSTRPEVEIQVEIITTRGDEKRGQTQEAIDPHAGRKGLFTAEIERALLGRHIDVAIHSAKDLPSDVTEGLEICAALPRAAVEDVLVLKTATDLATLPAGAVIATGSVRRQHQLRWLRPDLNVVDLRGNVPTRLRKLVANPWEAIILARAGLERLGFDCTRGAIRFEGTSLTTAILPTEQLMPAGGQGIVALQVRSDDAETRRILEPLSHAETLLCLRAEREFLRLLQGDCRTPVGVLATMEADEMTMQAQLFEGSEAEPKTAHAAGDPRTESPELIARALFDSLYGAKK